jgi:hypothetical protein
MAEGRIENLIPVRTEEEAREKGRAGGIKSGEVRREKKLFREAIEKKLGQSIDTMIDAMIEQSNKGNVQAITFLRDTYGEKPIDKLDTNIDGKFEIVMSDELKELSK